MDYFYPEFPLQQDDELVFQNTISYLACDQPTAREDLVTNYASLGVLDVGTLAINNSVDRSNLAINNKGKRQQLSALQDDSKGSISDKKQKRIIHRDTERQRRKEMEKLYASLRKLLPLSYVKGKRSASDVIHEAANYIKHMQKNIEEMRVKSDKLKKLMAASELDSKNKSLYSRLPINVTVRSCSVGVEILISSDFRNDTSLLSKVLEIALAEGLNVVSCVSTKANERIIHRVLSEVSHLGGVDMNKLQQKLTDIDNAQISSECGRVIL